ncbi:MAG: helix-turn-helix domain-containing protein [Planctomycetes bacterium]|nr:helix-turn-helix domain-containing protein [Planctomycetota bacterium]
MEKIVIKLSRQVKRHFHRTIKKIKDAGLKTRYLIILHTTEGYSRHTIAEMLLCSTSTVDRVRKRFAEEGVSGLIDRRGDNGPREPQILPLWDGHAAERIVRILVDKL